ncbi:SWI/SNF-related matrix-associated actin-dependent regulator of chromatin subfamily A-like protein 1 isoform X2 [Ceratina calcarata]|nr:SWI/SNF-related matrix-associated actin-dependent regulator of chromatin subfamily A-like protein 1 isoform X2 [Ceratina calcarata]
MISDERFKLETSAYFQPLIDALKTIPSRIYDMKTKTWNFILKDYEEVMQKVINFQSDVQIDGIPKKVLEIFRQKSSSDGIVDTDLSDIDPQLVMNLMPFQREGICYGISKGGRCMIADDMGLGKTIQALGIAHYFRKNWPLLIVIPASVRYQWSDTIYKFLPSVPAQSVSHFLNTNDYIDDSDIVITTYDLFIRAADTFKRKAFGFVILDEAHVLKNVKTERYKVALRVASKACHVVLLSGTPALSRPIELYSQINLIIPKFLGYQEYGIRYCAGVQGKYGWDFSGSSNMQELHLLLKRTCVIRRLKSEVLYQLPKKKREVIILDSALVSASTKEMQEMSKKMENTTLKGVARHSTLVQYYNETSTAKLKAVCEHISKLFTKKQKCIIFAHHRHVLDAICDLAESMNTKYIRIDGRTNPEGRKHQVDKFQVNESCIAAVLSITAANTGITLTAAQLVVFAELYWNPGALCQAEDRAYRIGQSDDVVIQYLIAHRTADDYLWGLIQHKMNVLNKVGLDQEFSLHDVGVSNQTLSQQKTLDSYANLGKRKRENNEDDIKEIDEDEIKEIDESVLESITEEYQPSEKQFKESLDLDDETFDLCDWDDME